MIVRESLVRDIARLIIWYPVRWMIGILPVSWSFALFRLFGNLQFSLSRNRRIHTNVQRGLQHVDRESIDTIVKTYLQNHYTDRLHIFTYPKLRHSSHLNKICSLEGLEYLDSALQKKKGAIIVLGHYGPIQLPLFLLGQSGYSLIQIGLPTDEGLSRIGRSVAFRLRCRYEAMIPARILPADTFLRPLFRHLHQNGVVMMNIDPAGGGKWIGRMEWVRFFGHSIPFPLGVAILASKTSAPVLPLSISRTASHRYVFRLHSAETITEPPFSAQFTGKLVEWYQQQVCKDPGLWHFWDEYEPGKLINKPTKS